MSWGGRRRTIRSARLSGTVVSVNSRRNQSADHQRHKDYGDKLDNTSGPADGSMSESERTVVLT
jgi:hypothetical protein